MSPLYNRIPPVKVPSKISWKEYGDASFKLENLDSLYCALARSALPTRQTMRFIVGLCCFYHKGVAGLLSEYTGAKFWRKVREIYPTAPRRSMRRHFRGSLGLKAVDDWETRWSEPERWMDELLSQPPRFLDIRKWALGIHQVGNYFAWKLNDMYHVLSARDTDMEGSVPHMMSKTLKGLAMIREGGSYADNMTEALTYFRGTGATSPPHHKRLVGISEIETLCCLLPDVRNGKVFMGESAAETYTGFKSVKCDTNDELVHSMLCFSPYSEQYIKAVATAKGYKS